MLEKNKSYTYEELKEIFKGIETDVVMNPFGDDQEKAKEKLETRSQLVTMMVAIPIMHTIKEKLFGKEEK